MDEEILGKVKRLSHDQRWDVAFALGLVEPKDTGLHPRNFLGVFIERLKGRPEMKSKVLYEIRALERDAHRWID